VAVVIAVAVTLSRHAGSMLAEAGNGGHLLGVLLDAMLTVPVAAAAVWLGGRAVSALAITTAPRLSTAALISLFFLPLFAPLAAVLTPLHGWIGVAGGEAHAAHQHAATGLGLSGLVSHGLVNAAAAQPVVLLASLLTLSVLVPAGSLARRRSPAYLATAITLAPVLIAGVVLTPVLAAPAASAAPDATTAATGGCTTNGQFDTSDDLYDFVRCGVDNVDRVCSAVGNVDERSHRRRGLGRRSEAAHPVREGQPIGIVLRRKLPAARMEWVTAGTWRERVE